MKAIDSVVAFSVFSDFVVDGYRLFNVSISVNVNFTDKLTELLTDLQTLRFFNFACLCMTLYVYVLLCMAMHDYA